MEIRSKGNVPSYHKIDFYLKYLEAVESGNSLDPSLLNRQHPYFLETNISKQMTLVRDVLNLININGAFD
jgi:hypothetical protein